MLHQHSYACSGNATLREHQRGRGLTDPPIIRRVVPQHVTSQSTICQSNDAQTTLAELEAEFGLQIASIVVEMTDDKDLPKAERKRLQIEFAQKQRSDLREARR